MTNKSQISNSKIQKKFNFAKAMEELRAINASFSSEDFELDQGIKKFKRALELAVQLKKHLAEAENEIKKIKVKFEELEKES